MKTNCNRNNSEIITDVALMKMRNKYKAMTSADL